MIDLRQIRSRPEGAPRRTGQYRGHGETSPGGVIKGGMKDAGVHEQTRTIEVIKGQTNTLGSMNGLDSRRQQGPNESLGV